MPSFINNNPNKGVSADALAIAQKIKTRREPMVLEFFGIGFTPMTSMPFFETSAVAKESMPAALLETVLLVVSLFEDLAFAISTPKLNPCEDKYKKSLQ
jgi:hypothetical protein